MSYSECVEGRIIFFTVKSFHMCVSEIYLLDTFLYQQFINFFLENTVTSSFETTNSFLACSPGSVNGVFYKRPDSILRMFLIRFYGQSLYARKNTYNLFFCFHSPR